MMTTDRSFRYASHRLWNQLPDSFRQPHQSCLDSPPYSLVSSSLLSSPLSSVIWDILTQLKIDIKSLFPLFQNQPDQTSVKHPARIHESCSLCDPGYYTLSSHRGKRATVDDHTQRGRWLRLPRKACRGRELWCTRYNRDRDTLFNSVLIHCFKSIYNVHEFFVQPGTIDYTLSSHRWSVFNRYSVKIRY